MSTESGQRYILHEERSALSYRITQSILEQLEFHSHENADIELART